MTPTHPLAARRILRLASGTALALLVSQLLAWPLAFITPILTLTLLALPLPALRFAMGLKLVVAMLLPMVAGLALLPLFQNARWAGILLVTLALFHSFYYTARGGSAALGTFMTIGLTIMVTIGSANPHLMTPLVQAFAVNALLGVTFVWIAHALLPDPDGFAAGPPRQASGPGPDLHEARRMALRAMAVVMPIALLFLFLSGSASYTAIMIKVASMGQQASTDKSRAMGRSLLASTLWGGLAAIVAWWLLGMWPSLLPYVLLVGLVGLLLGPRIFVGPGVGPAYSTWSYAYTTMLIILGPAVLDIPGSGGAGAAFGSRLLYFLIIALYGSAAVAVFDAFWPASQPRLEARPA